MPLAPAFEKTITVRAYVGMAEQEHELSGSAPPEPGCNQLPGTGNTTGKSITFSSLWEGGFPEASRGKTRIRTVTTILNPISPNKQRHRAIDL
jgi:hypothetical protein